jgi:hypothetical protein
MLLDELMPHYDVVERHCIRVHAPPATVYAAIRTADLAGGLLTRVLLASRALPAVLLAIAHSPREAVAEWRAGRASREVTLAAFERAGFRVVVDRPPEELVIGLLGRFWTPRGTLCSEIGVETFRIGPPAGYALAGWNFSIRSLSEGHSELRTETRVWCAPDAWRKFRLYWLIVRPGSGLIRQAMLRAICREAEGREGGERLRKR